MTTMVEQRVGYGPPTPVPIFQWEKEFREALQLYRERAPRSVLEVGSYHGGTLYHWLRNANPGTLVVSLDSYAVGVDNRHLYGEWVPEGVKLVTIAGDSRHENVAHQVAAWGPFEWVFIDAGHYYHEVSDDWRNYGPMVAPGGVCLFHDILPSSEEHPEIEVERLWREIQHTGAATREIIDDPNASWGGIGVVYL